MKRRILEFIICPTCLPDEVSPALTAEETSDDEVIEGSLRCKRCGSSYPIRAGTASLLPAGSGVSGCKPGRYEDPDLLGAYLWSHYADLFEDPDATDAYAQWARQLSDGAGLALETGCAPGRFTFEMAQKCGFAIGLDSSESFISAAREILRAGGLVFRLREEGRIYAKRSFRLPESWNSKNVEFIVGDAQALPFRSGAFSCVASLNVVDRLRCPMDHLLETNRVAKTRGAQFLLSDPFSWSEDASPPENWLGGKLDGTFLGSSLENISRLVSGSGSTIFSPPWQIAHRGAVWWKIRNHRNHFELIRSLFIKAER